MSVNVALTNNDRHNAVQVLGGLNESIVTLNPGETRVVCVISGFSYTLREVITPKAAQ